MLQWNLWVKNNNHSNNNYNKQQMLNKQNINTVETYTVLLFNEYLQRFMNHESLWIWELLNPDLYMS